MIRVYHKGTKTRFWIRDFDEGLLGTTRTISVFHNYIGCRRLPNGMGFACNRVKEKGLKFKASFIKKLSKKEVDKEDKQLMADLQAEINRQKTEEKRKGLK